ncbi:MAG: lysine--tRNA ligase [bacterium]
MDRDEIISRRLEKAEQLQQKGISPYKKVFSRTHTNSFLLENWEKLAETQIAAAGRIKAIRTHGKAVFADLIDETSKIQLYIKQDIIGDEKFEDLALLDIGDIIGVNGKVFKTRRGEVSVLVDDYIILTKTLRDLPEKFHGLRDSELRNRQRYLDLIANPEVKEKFHLRIKIIQYIRNFLTERGFLEVETPMMQPIPGGALARPFCTHHNALDIDLYLRVAPELYLKRLVVGGFEKIFEINRNFRNEGVSTRHNPEFTMLELYQAYADYNHMMELTEEMLHGAAHQLLGAATIEYQGTELDFARPWKRITWLDTLKEFGGITLNPDASEAQLAQICQQKNIPCEQGETKGKILDRLFKELVEPNLIQPTFVIDYPTEISPLARQRDDDPLLTERFELYINSFEVANAFSELTDPVEQEKRFLHQEELRRQGETEAHAIDHDFLTALEHGMPPTGGLGIGIDRLVMIFTNSTSIRDVIFFPLLRPVE